MPWVDPFDVTKPDAAHYASTGPAELQANARGLAERLDSFTNFSTATDPAADPVKLDNAVVASAMLQDASVTTAKQADASVTNPKLAAALKAELVKVLKATLAPPGGTNLASLSVYSQTVAVAGAKANDRCFVTANVGVPGTAYFFIIANAECLADGVVTVKLGNPTAGLLAIDTNWYVTVLTPLT